MDLVAALPEKMVLNLTPDMWSPCQKYPCARGSPENLIEWAKKLHPMSRWTLIKGINTYKGTVRREAEIAWSNWLPMTSAPKSFNYFFRNLVQSTNSLLQHRTQDRSWWSHLRGGEAEVEAHNGSFFPPWRANIAAH